MQYIHKVHSYQRVTISKIGSKTSPMELVCKMIACSNSCPSGPAVKTFLNTYTYIYISFINILILKNFILT